MTTRLSLAHGSKARTDRARLVTLSNAGTDWTAANMRGTAGPCDSYGWLTDPDARSAGRLASYVIYSYATPIAWRIGGSWVVLPNRYTRTTTRHQSFVRPLAAA